MIYLGSDHAGYALKQSLIKHLEKKGEDYTDCGCSGETVDYPDIAAEVCKNVLKDSKNKGVLICGTGVGISIAANRNKGIRAALCSDSYSAKYTRMHNNANIICLGGRVLGEGLASELLDVFLDTEFEGGKHSFRIEKFDK